MSSSWGTLAAVWDPPALRLVMEGYSLPIARTGPVITLLRDLMPDVGRSTGRGLVFVQYHDFIMCKLRSVGFGRRLGEVPEAVLIPDPYFLGSNGYQPLRARVADGGFVPWSARRDVVFWRGSATHDGQVARGAQVDWLAEIPRVALCLKLRDVAGTDAALINPWLNEPAEAATAWLTANGILRAAVTAEEQAQHRYLIDIDGVANAWGMFEKLLMGSCVLKVESPYEQWFYDDIVPWIHYVPVAADLSDLQQRIDWCRQNSTAAAAIAAAGQAYALGFSYDDALNLIRGALRRCFTPF
jgi:hypothetical protein